MKYIRSRRNKVELFARILTHVRTLTDGSGKRMDPKIAPVVAALQINGVWTTGSCDGHRMHGERTPWIDIGFEPTREEHRRSMRMQGLRVRLRRQNRPQIRRMISLLDGFYRKHHPSAGCRLVLMPLGWYGAARLTNQYNIVDEPQSLHALQSEFSRFGRFLKSRFLNPIASSARHRQTLRLLAAYQRVGKHDLVDVIDTVAGDYLG